jgi:O-acetyl-ADP-ribose deacetylase (regulator of RNase III)
MEIKIYLRDRNSDIVNAWKSEFNGYKNIDISCGNILDCEADAIISPANSFGFMDGGIDLIYSEYFGEDLQKRLQNLIRNKYHGEIPVGMAAIIETGHDVIKYLISAPTMRVPANVSSMVNTYLAFRASLIEVLKFNENNKNKISSILCPGLGTSAGKMAPKNCAVQMKHAYDSIIENKVPFPKSLYEACYAHNILEEPEL